MEKKVLLISENEKSFMTNATEKALTAAGMKVNNLLATSSILVDSIAGTDIVLIRGGEVWSIHPNLLQDIKNACAEQHKQIALYGNPDEIEPLKRVFPWSMIAAEYIRPVDVAVVAEQMSLLLARLEISHGRKRILVVDDSSVMLRTIMEWLERKYQVVLANSATRAMSAIQKEKPDLILLDYEMPICSGGQFLEMLRSEDETRSIPVIFLTSRGDEETVRSVLSLRPEGYILKTSPKEQIIATINNFFEKRQRR